MNGDDKNDILSVASVVVGNMVVSDTIVVTMPVAVAVAVAVTVAVPVPVCCAAARPLPRARAKTIEGRILQCFRFGGSLTRLLLSSSCRYALFLWYESFG